MFARQLNIRHELHANGDFPFSFAGFASSSGYVKTKKSGFVVSIFRQGLLGKNRSYFVKNLQVGYWITPRTSSDWILIDQLNGFDRS